MTTKKDCNKLKEALLDLKERIINTEVLDIIPELDKLIRLASEENE